MVKKRPKPKPKGYGGSNSSVVVPVVDTSVPLLNATISTPPVFMKVCRLCETKDGPFLNIFDEDKVTAKRIEEVLPFTIAENDELPHKICFRCSAKLEELYEFILKCIKTQDNLLAAMGNNRMPAITKSKFRLQWEKQLDKKNISNDDICNALIRKAMEGIKGVVKAEDDAPLLDIDSPRKLRSNANSEKKEASSKNSLTYEDSESDHDEVSLKQVKLAIEKCDANNLNKNLEVKSLSSNKSNSEPSTVQAAVDTTAPKVIRTYSLRKSQVNEPTSKAESKPNEEASSNMTAPSAGNNVNNDVKPAETPAKEPEAPPAINIMDHVSTIKVNSVGTLFLCQLCNRNFLKKEVVLAHGCAKNNVPKDKFLHNAPPREVPKPPVTVKYIKMDTDFKKTTEKAAETRVETPKPAEKKPAAPVVHTPVQQESKPTPKPKAGPASKIKKSPTVTNDTQEKKVPTVNFPSMPSLNSRYKLVPGPNNTFSLVEEPTAAPVPPSALPPALAPAPSPVVPPAPAIPPALAALAPKITIKPPTRPAPKSKKRKLEEPAAPEPTEVPIPQPTPAERPYPVGFFSTSNAPHHSGTFTPPPKPSFATPAMKKQSYTVLQTGNPSKLVISAKPRAEIEEQRKKSKKSKPDVDIAPKDGGFFTIIDVGTLDQPSYVLPTDSIIQESQITTSTPAAPPQPGEQETKMYACNMCTESFSREGKLLAHIQSHFNQMDKEDELRRQKSGPSSKKKSKKS